jgi:mRNA-degrading endonuclease toxin of MazEF toxin-antitoxin module
LRRGEIYHVSLDPVQGGEQQGARPALVISPDAYNRQNIPIVCPISAGAVGQRLKGLTVSLATCGTRTTGVVLCGQVRSLDLRARKARRIEVAPKEIIDEVVDCLQDIFAG